MVSSLRQLLRIADHVVASQLVAAAMIPVPPAAYQHRFLVVTLLPARQF
jgi:hypothetical protein